MLACGPIPEGRQWFPVALPTAQDQTTNGANLWVTDRLHDRRTVEVPCDDLVNTLSAWLAELGAHSSLVEDLARAVCAGDWPTAYAIGDLLSVDVTVAA
ncbi:MAG: hypothetical protein QOF66_1182 [Mycobacterium sp.]|nr:hypothetical protein [Mycobacterium sp.]